MDTKTEGLVRLMDQAIGLAQERLDAKLLGRSDPASVDGLRNIISGLQYRREEAVHKGFKVYDTDISLGLVRAALEYDVQDSELVRKIGEVESYFTQNYVRRPTS